MNVTVCDWCKKTWVDTENQIFLTTGLERSASGCGSEDKGEQIDLCGKCAVKVIKKIQSLPRVAGQGVLSYEALWSINEQIIVMVQTCGGVRRKETDGGCI